MVHHPFDSFQSVESFVDAAIDDPRVVAIKMTLYRIGSELAGRRSAHQGGRARQAGGGARRAESAIRRAQQHRVGETAGRCRRARRLWRGKAEDPLQALPRRPARKTTRFAATCTSARGNYNRTTARLYTDIGIFTARPKHRRRRVRAVQLSDGLFEPDRLPRAADCAGRAAPAIRQARRARNGSRPTRASPARIIVKSQCADRSEHRAAALSRVAGRA